MAETAQRSYSEKMQIIKRLLYMPVINSVLDVCGEPALKALELYDKFMGALADAGIRAELDRTGEQDRTKNETFRHLKDDGHHCSWRLMSLLQQTYAPGHPVHRALLFLNICREKQIQRLNAKHSSVAGITLWRLH